MSQARSQRDAEEGMELVTFSSTTDALSVPGGASSSNDIASNTPSHDTLFEVTPSNTIPAATRPSTTFPFNASLSRRMSCWLLNSYLLEAIYFTAALHSLRLALLFVGLVFTCHVCTQQRRPEGWSKWVPQMMAMVLISVEWGMAIHRLDPHAHAGWLAFGTATRVLPTAVHALCQGYLGVRYQRDGPWRNGVYVSMVVAQAIAFGFMMHIYNSRLTPVTVFDHLKYGVAFVAGASKVYLAVIICLRLMDTLPDPERDSTLLLRMELGMDRAEVVGDLYKQLFK